MDASVNDRDGQPIRRGDRVRDVKSGETGEVWSIPNDKQVYYGPSSGNYSHPGNLVKMERTMDAVDMARATRCPYCTKTVAMSRRALGDHRAQMGMCAGSGRRVAEFDSCGRVVFEAAAQTFARDASGQDIQVGDTVSPQNSNAGIATGERFKVTRVSSDTIWVENARTATDWDDGAIRRYGVVKV